MSLGEKLWSVEFSSPVSVHNEDALAVRKGGKMPRADYGSGVKLSWSNEHRDGTGRLISKQMSFESPELTCIKPKCVHKYLKDCFAHAAISVYHSERAAYAERHRNDFIDMKYRTGEPSPKTFWEAISEIAKLGR